MVRSKVNHFRVQEMKQRGCRRCGWLYACGKKKSSDDFCLGFAGGLQGGASPPALCQTSFGLMPGAITLKAPRFSLGGAGAYDTANA